MIAFTDIETDGLREKGGHILEVALVITDDQLNEVAHESVVVKPYGETLDDVVARMDQKVRDMHTKSGLLDEVRERGIEKPAAEIILVQFAETQFAGIPPVEVNKCVKCGARKETHPTYVPRGGACGEPIMVGGHQEYCARPKGHGGYPPRLGMELDGPGHYRHTILPEDPIDITCDFSAKTEPAIKHTPMAGSTVAYFDRRWLREHMATFEGLFSHRSIDASTLTELSQRWAPSIYENRPKNQDGPKHRALDDARESAAYLRYFRACGFVGGWASAGFAPTMEELRTHATSYPNGCCDSCQSRLGARA